MDSNTSSSEPSEIRNPFLVKSATQLFWTIVVVVVITLVATGFVGAQRRSVTSCYRLGAEAWLSGKPIYDMKGYGFVYLPQAAILYSTWAILPETLGEIVWRIANIVVFASGMTRLTRGIANDARWYLIISIAAVAIGMGSISNGQATVMMSGFMMLGCAALGERRWNLAAFFLVLAFSCKPTSLILLLLVGGVFPRMIPRLLIALTCMAIVPFLTQTPEYVISQFVALRENYRVAYKDGEIGSWAHLFGMLRVFGIDTPSSVQQSARVMAGLLTFVASRIIQQKLPSVKASFYLYAISTCYLMLFSPRVEGCTYVMIGPVYGFLLADAWLNKKNKLSTSFIMLAIVTTVFSFDMALLVTQRPNEVWLSPFICIFMTVYLCWSINQELRSSVGRSCPAQDDRAFTTGLPQAYPALLRVEAEFIAAKE